jgi:coenzyme F390 synthetase
MMADSRFYNSAIETLGRDDLNALIDERVVYTISYAAEHSPFYRDWFRANKISPDEVRTHEDLLDLPIISGKTVRENQPPQTSEFRFLSAPWSDIFTIHETSGTSGVPKSFFLTYEEWLMYAEKYARIFVSQGFNKGDRVVVCTTYGMNVGANTMTLAAHRIGFTVIPTGNCNFPVRTLTNYRPTAIIGSVFKLLHLAGRLDKEGIDIQNTGLERIIVGGEAFAEESREYVRELWGCDIFNTYGSTEGSMCGECNKIAGLHVPEDLVHLDLYNPAMAQFVKDGECGRAVLTTLLPVGAKCGTLLINYDTEDTSVVVSRERCTCGRTHERIMNPQREAETVWVQGTPFNRVDIERGVFQHENMQYLNGEYEAFLYSGQDEQETILRVGLECEDPGHCDHRLVEEYFLRAFLKNRPGLSAAHSDGTFKVLFRFASPGGLELHTLKGRPKRLADRR